MKTKELPNKLYIASAEDTVIRIHKYEDNKYYSDGVMGKEWDFDSENNKKAKERLLSGHEYAYVFDNEDVEWTVCLDPLQAFYLF